MVRMLYKKNLNHHSIIKTKACWKVLFKLILNVYISVLVPDDVKLGVIRLDYDYPPIPGDVDSQDSFNYDVIYRTVPGLTFAMAQSGRCTITFTTILEYFKTSLLYRYHS